LGRAYYKR